MILYSDLVKVYLDRENGEVMGLDARNYRLNHRTRDLSRLSDRGFDFRPDYEKGSGRAPQALEDRTAEEVDLDPTLTARIREAVAAARF